MEAPVVALASSYKPHALVLPVPAQGHINPMLNFSFQLAVRGFIITFVNTEKAHQRMLEIQSQSQDLGVDIRFATIPDGSQQPLPGLGDQSQTISASEIIQGIALQVGLIEEMILSSRATPNPITCIITDSYLPWTQGLANKLGIKRVSFWTSNAGTLAVVVEMKSGKLKIKDVDVDDPNELSCSHWADGVPAVIRPSDLLSTLPLVRNPEVVEMFTGRLDGVQDAACVVVNTFEELEAASLEASASCQTNVRCVGPLLPPSNDKGTLSASFRQEESMCIPWLDQQAVGSVLYISFGSFASLSTQQLEELALGIEESKQPFLWVARGHTELFPEGFLDRTHGHGLVINWAPQIQVLGHVAVGGFLTHCGWNSTLESIHMGVPMLCYPIFADQHLNTLLITKVWEVGISMQKEKEEDVIKRGEVQKAVIALMHSQELRRKAATWKVAAHHALEQGGSSYSALDSVIHDLTKVA